MKKLIISVYLIYISLIIYSQETKFSTNIQNGIGFGFSDKPTWVFSVNNNYKINKNWNFEFDFTTSSHTELRSVISEVMQIPVDYVFANTYQIFSVGCSNKIMKKEKAYVLLKSSFSYAFRNHSNLLENSSFFDDFYWAQNKYHYFGLQTGIIYRVRLTNRFFLDFNSSFFYYPFNNKIMNNTGCSIGFRI